MDEWGVGRAGVNDGLVILFDLDTSLQHGQVQLYAGSGFAGEPARPPGHLRQRTCCRCSRAAIWTRRSSSRLAQVVSGTFEEPKPGGDRWHDRGPARTAVPATPRPTAPSTTRPASSAPTRSSRPRQRSTRSRRGPAPRSSSTPRTAATYPTTEETEAKARALIDQWGIGRAGFNDGLVIFFDMDPSLEHGQVQLYAAPGFEAAYLSNAERQAIFDNDMLPHLRAADFDAALDVALQKVDAAATPEHAATLQTRAPGQRRGRARRGADRPARPVGLGVRQLAALRQGPGLPRRRVGAHPGATARPDRRVGGDDHGRRHVAASADDGDARPRLARPARLPRGPRRPAVEQEGRRRHEPRPG